MKGIFANWGAKDRAAVEARAAAVQEAYEKQIAHLFAQMDKDKERAKELADRWIALPDGDRDDILLAEAIWLRIKHAAADPRNPVRDTVRATLFELRDLERRKAGLA